jgi:hypothetical protein
VNSLKLAATFFRLAAVFAVFANFFRQVVLGLFNVTTAPVSVLRVGCGR